MSFTASPPTLSAQTRVCGVLGWPIRHSASPAMHNAAMRALGLDWCYAAWEVPPSELKNALEGARALRLAGLNLTVPHKLLALEWMDELDDSATRWGAVNTVVFLGQNPAGDWIPLGQLDSAPTQVRTRGYNTDADAVIRALREDAATDPSGARVLLLGAGGAGRAAALRLADEGVSELWLVNRTESKAADLAREIAAKFHAVDVHLGYPDHPVELVLNATSLGLKREDPLPIDETQFNLRSADAVFDMVYRPVVTPLLQRAQAAGCRTANGLGMLLYQGAAALELWTNQPAPIDVMRAALIAEVYSSPRR